MLFEVAQEEVRLIRALTDRRREEAVPRTGVAHFGALCAQLLLVCFGQLRHAREAEIILWHRARVHGCAEALIVVSAIDPARRSRPCLGGL